MNNDKYLERRKKIIKIIIPLFVIVLIGIIIYSVSTMIYRSGKVAVNVVYAPFAATVKINGEKIGNNDTYYIVPGDYRLRLISKILSRLSRNLILLMIQNDSMPH